MSRHPATRNPGALRHRPDCLSSADRHNVDRVRPLALLGALVMACSSLPADAGAPRDGDVFTNTAGSRPWPGPDITLPFFARKAWTSLVGRDGAAPRVPYDRAAMLENPSLTWIGHSTLLVRMDGVTFLTDPVFSERASPVSFAGPKRLVPPGVPLDELPPVDFVTLSHDHYDHTDLPSIEVLARRGTRFVHLDPEAAVRAALDLEARYTVPMHWGTFDLPDEPLDEPPRRFRAAADAAHLGPDRAWVLAVGETRRW